MDRSPEAPKLSVIIPCYNEKERIVELVNSVLAAPIHPKEVIVVDDGSTDGTRELLAQKVEPLVSKVLYAPLNAGKGAAIRRGLREAHGEVVIIQDADFEYSPTEYPQVVDPVLDGQADACYGSRFAQGWRIPGAYWSNLLANHFLTWLSNRFTGLGLTDMETCFKAIRREVFQSLELCEDRFGIEPEVTAKLAHSKCRVLEVPISYRPRTHAAGKKIGFKDGWQAVWCILKYR